MPRIDVHNHVIPTEVIDLFNADPAYGVSITDGEWRGVHHVPFQVGPSFYDVAAKLEQLDQAGIDAAVVSAPPPLFFYEQDGAVCERLCEVTNVGLAQFCASRSDRLQWLANLPMQDPDRAVGAYRTAITAGCAGAALGTSVAGTRLDDPSFERFWAVAAEAGLPVLLHPAFNEPHTGLNSWYLQNVIGNPFETTVAVERLLCAGVLTRNPALRLILVHGGGAFPYLLGRLRHARLVRPDLVDTPPDLLAPLSQLYFDSLTHDAEALRFLVTQVGEHHVVLGTDMPFDMAPQAPMADLEAALSEQVARCVAQETPAMLFPLKAEKATNQEALAGSTDDRRAGGTRW